MRKLRIIPNNNSPSAVVWDDIPSDIRRCSGVFRKRPGAGGVGERVGLIFRSGKFHKIP